MGREPRRLTACNSRFDAVSKWNTRRTLNTSTITLRSASADSHEYMLWTFHRQGQRLVYEIRSALDAPGFELAIQQPDGTETIELFVDHVAADHRSQELQRQLLNDGWWIAGDPRR
jgi:hypothetical protein